MLLIIVFGIINFGALFGQQLSLNHAVREGARAAVVAGTGQDEDVLTLVQGAVSGIAMDDEDVFLSPETASNQCAGNGGGDDLVVEARYPATPLVPIPVPGVPDSITLSATAVFRCEW
jgi:Flp pilus assembly protein TadG